MTRELSSPSHKTVHESVFRLILSLWTWGLCIRMAVIPKELMWNFFVKPFELKLWSIGWFKIYRGSVLRQNYKEDISLSNKSGT